MLDVDVETNSLYLFTTYITNQLICYLKDDYNFEIHLRVLSHKDQCKIRNIKSDEIRIKQLVTRLFTMLVINTIKTKSRSQNPGNSHQESEFNPWTPLQFTYNEYGKPELVGMNLSFSASSSNNLISILIQTDDRSPIGIDLSHSTQKINPCTILTDFQAIFAPPEIDQLSAIALVTDRYYVFNQFWTLKEAFTKVLGTGLNVDLAKFWFDLHGNHINATAKSSIDLANPSQVCSRYHIDWVTGIDLDIHALAEEKKVNIKSLTSSFSSPSFGCKSGTLMPAVAQPSQTLPVLVSVVTHNDSSPVNYHIDFHRLLCSWNSS